VYEEPGADIGFGDIFRAEWFFDAYIRRDAVPLVAFTAKGGMRAWRQAAPSHERDYLFAHGQQREAVLLSDDCEVETIMRRGGRRRLIFAAIERLPVSETQAKKALATRAFRRFPLPPYETFVGGTVEFQQLFGVGPDAISGNGKDPRLLRLDADMRLHCEMRWNAYATRRGPLTHIDNAEKLARLLTADGDSARLERLKAGEDDADASHLDVAKAIADALGTAWEIEGATLNDVAEAYERSDPPEEAMRRTSEQLQQLAARAQRAAALLGAAHKH